MATTFLTAEWRKLAIANYIVDPQILLPCLPYGTELDYWNDKCIVSLIGFRFINTRLRGFSIPFHRNFEEINLRFYVRHKSGNEWRRGVTFIKEIVPKHALTFVANTFYGEKYVTMPTRHTWKNDETSLHVSYEWKHNGSHDRLAVSANLIPAPIAIGSEEEFITEHYWGYTAIRPNRTSQYAVEHPRWETYPVKHTALSVRFGLLYGPAFAFLETQEPSSVMLAEGSAILVKTATSLM